jgi:hypothetical protein
VVNPDQDDADGDGVGDACDLTCADGLDNDQDGFADYPDDPGCRSPDWHTENPACNDGIDNDGDGLVDLGDLQCGNAWQLREALPSRCGLGWELALVLTPLMRLRKPARVIRDPTGP